MPRIRRCGSGIVSGVDGAQSPEPWAARGIGAFTHGSGGGLARERKEPGKGQGFRSSNAMSEGCVASGVTSMCM
ncbi:hypothetical protein DFQ14_102273 [Halopolyspora algeriensis]|uniref:Uncharacterized protein n=1 Tax=Halopolyspora algeriensis TaxID=1500506 RepID=A0A368W055_9ACTN|nr:hypothetical protein DFQ14_102273 [Halopolyspora algeriensis]TQM55384.1 hypothetical protein FHU43_0147 [Halopolyspora algeriensis]